MSDPTLLISRHLYGVATADEQRELCAWLKASPANARDFALEAFIHRRIRDTVIGEAESVSTAPFSIGRAAPAVGRRRAIGGWLAAAALIAVAVTIVVAPSLRMKSVMQALADNVNVELVAALDAKWAAGQPRQGGAMAAGAHELVSGLAMLRYPSGAQVVIEAPARFEVGGESHLRLDAGEATVLCPTPASRGFTLDLPAARVVDLGTEFGVRSLPDGEVETHVFNGSVELRSPGNAQSLLVLNRGDAMRIDRAGALHKRQAADTGFVRAADLIDRSLAASPTGRDRWSLHRLRWQQDTDLLLSFDGASSGASTISSRFAGGRAMKIEHPSDAPRVSVPGTFDCLTLAAWVRFDAEDNTKLRHRGLLMSDGWDEPGQVHWQRKGKGFRVSFYQPGEPEDGRFPATSYELDDGAWHLLVSVIDTAAPGSIAHYVDGRVISREPSGRAVPPLRLGPCTVGGWFPGSAAKAEKDDRSLNGSIDDVLVWGRALTEEEVARLYRESSP